MDIFSFTPGRWRNFGLPFVDQQLQQIRVYNATELSDCVSRWNGVCDCYISSCEYGYVNGVVVPYPKFLLLDFDGANNVDLEADIAQVMVWAEQNRYAFRLHRSGCKGYHIILQVSIRGPWSNLQEVRGFYFTAFHSFINELVSDLGLKCADPQVKDFSRLFRLPGTVNLKCNKLCEALHSFAGRMVDLDSYGNGNTKMSVISPDCRVKLFFPCIEQGIRDINPTHDMRRWAVQYRRIQGYSTKEILDEFRSYKWRDWNEELTKYYIEYYYSYPAFTFRCNKNFCLDDCPFRRGKR